jgi:hypothetical protein
MSHNYRDFGDFDNDEKESTQSWQATIISICQAGNATKKCRGAGSDQAGDLSATGTYIPSRLLTDYSSLYKDSFRLPPFWIILPPPRDHALTAATTPRLMTTLQREGLHLMGMCRARAQSIPVPES